MVGTHVWDQYPVYEEWIERFDLNSDTPDMMKIAKAHFDHLPVWINGNAYLGGALHFCKEKDYLFDDKSEVYVNVKEDGDKVTSLMYSEASLQISSPPMSSEKRLSLSRDSKT